MNSPITFDPTTTAELDSLAQWIWSNRDDKSNPCNNYARLGQWVAVGFDGGGTCSVHHFPGDELAKLFVHLVRSPHESQRLQGWDMTSFYESWDASEMPA